MRYLWNCGYSTKYILDDYGISGVEINPYKVKNKNEIEVNYRVRFEKIFQTVLENYLEENQLKEEGKEISNIIFHLLAELDRKSYITKLSLKKELILKDIECCRFGKNIKNNFNIFSKIEKEIILENIIVGFNKHNLYSNFEKICKEIFPEASKLYYFHNKKKFCIYLGCEENGKNKKKIEILEELFWDITEDLEIYYDKHFGIIDKNETMIINNIIID